MQNHRVALSHDYLNQYGGAERVVEVLHDLFPEAPVFTSIYDAESMPESYREWDIRTSFLQKAPAIHRRHQPYLPLYPLAFKMMRVPDEYDVLLSSSSAWGKGISHSDSVMHVCYCHSPMRFAWDFEHYAERERMDRVSRAIVRPVLRRLRNWDRSTSRRVDHVIANSRTVQKRISRYWGRCSTVIHPPVDTTSATPVSSQEVDDYFLLISRLVPYKRFDIAIEAANRLGFPLKIVGDGRARSDLEAISGPNVEFLGRVSDSEKNVLLARCRAAIFPAEDDFGIAQVEVQAAGRPVIALDRGGAQETVIDGVTGVLFSPQTVDGLMSAIERLARLNLSVEEISRHADRFSRARFEDEITEFVAEKLVRRNRSHQSHRDTEAVVPGTTRASEA